ncbi:MAG: carbohydrate ABC transporter permease [Firmicutes bacterium]|nr:carbohydrate ABC transporter permease [Bacillota bacterium]
MAIYKKSLGEKVFDIFNIAILTIYALACAIPFIHVLSGSFTAGHLITGKEIILIPKKFTLENYRFAFTVGPILMGLKSSLILTVFGTMFELAGPISMAYPLAHKDLVGRNFITWMIIIAMFTSGGLIPTYLLIRALGLLNTYWALFIPQAVGITNIIYFRNFFSNIPKEIEESALLDGANDLYILVKIILPLSVPVIATFTLFIAVGNWNAFFGPLIYLNDYKKWPIQVILRQITLTAQIMTDTGYSAYSGYAEDEMPTPEAVKLAVIIIATGPIILLYPLLQKHFVKGIIVGSLKG